MAAPSPLQPAQTPVSYEVSLWGEISGDVDAINPIINRFTLNTKTTQKLNIRDVIFEPNEEPAIGEPLYIRCRKDNTKANAPWSIFTYGRPQPERISPDAVVRPVAMMHVCAGSTLAFASALGYRCVLDNRIALRRLQIICNLCRIRSDTIKQGYLFTRGSLSIHMFHLPEKPKDTDIIDVDPEPETNQSWNVDIRQYPVVSVKDSTITEAIDNVLGFKLLMKGLLDLERKDIA
ncbi:hypothetical protein BDV93DRAFT_278325 [Ceratobasidium sp. AG-I]|nr:hypothetical protein BDV93DRAFT_278325 [Ceratobasidium sp. AG-I]